MRFPNQNMIDLGAESGEDATISTAALQARLMTLDGQLRGLAADTLPRERLRLQLDACQLLLDLEDSDEVWRRARPAFQLALDNQLWEPAVRACDLIFQSEHVNALAALGQGVWLAVTFPVDPALTLTLLQHIIAETPDEADGAAVAAATAAYVVDLRAQGRAHNDLSMEALQMMGTVARRHGNVDGQAAFETWMKRLELDEPAKFLVRLRNVVDVLVQDDWWFDRDRLRDALPAD